MLLGHLLHESCVLQTGEVMKDFLDFLKDFLLRKTVNLWTEKSVTQPAVPPRAMPVVWFIKNVCNLAKKYMLRAILSLRCYKTNCKRNKNLTVKVLLRSSSLSLRRQSESASLAFL